MPFRKLTSVSFYKEFHLQRFHQIVAWFVLPFFGILIPRSTGLLTTINSNNELLLTIYYIGVAYTIWFVNITLFAYYKKQTETKLFDINPFIGYGNMLILLLISLLSFLIALFLIYVSTPYIIHAINAQNILLTAFIASALATFIAIAYETIFLNTKSLQLRSDKEKFSKKKLDLLGVELGEHFLGNAILNIKYLTYKDPINLLTFYNALEETYKYSVLRKNNFFSTLHDELSYMEHYRTLMTITRKESVEIIVDFAPTNNRLLFLPTSSLQLLLENTFKHNQITTEAPLTITISIEGDTLVFKNILIPKKFNTDFVSSGIGLRNIQDKYLHLSENLKITTTKENNYFITCLPILKNIH
jgi:hypothetical protein